MSLTWTTSDEAGFTEVVRLCAYLGVFLLAGSIASPSRNRSVITGIAAGIVAVALVALGARFLGLGSGDAALVEALPSASGRLSFPIGYWNALGAFLALGLPPICWIASRNEDRLGSGVALAAFAPLILAVFMSASRGAVIAAVVGLVVFACFTSERRRAVAATMVGLATALPSIVVASSASGVLDSPGDGSPGSAELSVVLALIIGMAIAGTLGGRIVDSLSRSRLLAIRVPVRAAVAGGLVALVAVVALAGPQQLIGDFRQRADVATQSDERAFGIVSASGSGRTQFWDAALDAFVSEPVRGIGAGGYSSYWNRVGGAATLVRNAHSEPLELLAEVGVLGFICFVGFFALVITAGVRASRAGREEESQGSQAAAALAVVAASLVGFAIDWTWQVPAVVVPVLLLAGTLVGVAVRRPSPAASLPAGAPSSSGPRRHRGRGPRALGSLGPGGGDLASRGK